MRWGLGRRKSGGDPHGKPATEWADRLDAIGANLDGQGVSLRDVALSVAGENVRVIALTWHTSRFGASWGPISFHLLNDVGAAGAARDPRSWAARLQAAGRLLDVDSRHVKDPCVVELGEQFLVTALVSAVGSNGEQWDVANWRLTGETMSPGGQSGR